MLQLKKLFAIGVFTISLPFSFFSPAHRSVAVNSIGNPAVNSPSGANTSLNWAGYVADEGTFTSVGSTWIVPTVAAASSTEADVTWVGIGGVTKSDLIQVGTQAVTNGSGGVTYEAWYEILPQATAQIPLTISAGDSVTVSLTEVSSNNWQISFKDNTTNQTYQTSVEYASSHSSAEWIEEMPSSASGLVPLDNFGSVSFAGGTAVMNGNTVTIAGSGAQPLSMTNGNGQILASPSSLGGDGESFTVTRTSVAAAPSGTSRYFVTRGRSWRIGVGISGYSRHTRGSASGTFNFLPGRGSHLGAYRQETRGGMVRGYGRDL